MKSYPQMCFFLFIVNLSIFFNFRGLLVLFNRISMIHYKLILITLLSLAVIQGQDDSTRAVEWGYLDSLAGIYYYDDIPFTGPVVKQLDIGLMAGEFKDGIKHGLWQTLNQIGDPIMIGHFDNGKKHGDFEQWYDDGASRHRELIATFDQDKYVGKYREWYENGKRSIWGFYIDGKEQGRYIDWYSNGKKALKA